MWTTQTEKKKTLRATMSKTSSFPSDWVCRNEYPKILKFEYMHTLKKSTKSTLRLSTKYSFWTSFLFFFSIWVHIVINSTRISDRKCSTHFSQKNHHWQIRRLFQSNCKYHEFSVPACKKLEWWGAVWGQVRFAYGPADGTATHYLLLQ